MVANGRERPKRRREEDGVASEVGRLATSGGGTVAPARCSVAGTAPWCSALTMGPIVRRLDDPGVRGGRYLRRCRGFGWALVRRPGRRPSVDSRDAGTGDR